MNIDRAIIVENKVYPFVPKLEELFFELQNNLDPDFFFDYESTIKNRTFIWKKKDGIYLVVDMDKLAYFICNKQVQVTSIRRCSVLDFSNVKIPNLKLGEGTVWKVIIDDEYDIPGTRGEKIRSIFVEVFFDVKTGFLFDNNKILNNTIDLLFD